MSARGSDGTAAGGTGAASRRRRRATDATPPPHGDGGARPQRPLLGLALGGGVARGFAHIGVLRVLESAGIVPDVIAGTSIGAIAGACYVAGVLDAFEGWARSLNRLKVIGYLDFKIGRSGLLAGDRLAGVLHRHLGDRRVEALPRPFAAIATDLSSGREVWIRQGPLTEAVRASYALPGVFPAVRHDGRLLVDGGLLNPVPVAPCLAMGAHVVAAVNLTADRGRRDLRALPGAGSVDELDAGAKSTGRGRLRALQAGGFERRLFQRRQDEPSVVSVMMATMGIMLDRIARTRLAADAPDVMIAPRIGHIGFADFDRADELIAQGAAAAEAMVGELRTLLAGDGAQVHPPPRDRGASSADPGSTS